MRVERERERLRGTQVNEGELYLGVIMTIFYLVAIGNHDMNLILCQELSGDELGSFTKMLNLQ